jgi:transcriptional regulator with XRE-family HTH domain/tetratricopeptide (TPR) repeat protein
MAGGEHCSFGTILRQYRLTAGLTQAALAERAGISERAVSDLERDPRRRPQLDTATQLAEALALLPAERAVLVAAAHATMSTPVPASARAYSLPVVGRTAERVLLERHLLREGPPVLLLAGEPGIGKTRLLEEAMQRAGGLGWRALRGGCGRQGGEEPYAPVLDALVHALQHMSPVQRLAALRGCAWLARLLPEMAEERDLAELMALPPLGTLPPAQERRLIFDSVGRFLANIAAERGTLLVLDDLQWADGDALALLFSLARAADQVAGPAPLRIVGAYRDTEVPAEHPLAGVQADLAQAGLVTHHTLAPLAPAETRALLKALLPAEGARGHAAWAEQLAERTGGVPFFVLSCARNLTDARPLGAFAEDEQAAEALPWTVQQSIQQRLATLADAVRHLLGTAAVVGRVVPVDLLTRVSGQPEEVVVDALDAATQVRLLEDDQDGGYRFRHDLVREVVEADLTSARRALLHRRVAEALEAGPAEPAAEVLAYHYVRGGPTEKAVRYLEAAGDHALAQRALSAAAAYYRELVERLGSLSRPLGAARVREKWAEVLRLATQYDAALAVLEEATAAYRAAGDREGVARSVAAIGFIYAVLGTGRCEEGLKRVQVTLAGLDEGTPSHGLAALYRMFAWLADAVGRHREAVTVAERAEELARRVGDARIEAAAAQCRGVALRNLGLLAAGRQALKQAIAGAEAVGDLGTMCFAVNGLTVLYLWDGDLDAAWRSATRALETAQRHGDSAAIAFMLLQTSWVAIVQGNRAEAHRSLEQAGTLYRSIEGLRGVALERGLWGWLALEEGHWEEAAQALDEGIAVAASARQPLVLLRAVTRRAELDIVQGDAEKARTRLQDVLDAIGPDEWETTFALPTLAWAQVELGDLAAARAVLARALHRARIPGMRLALIDALRVRALLALAQGEMAVADRAVARGLVLAWLMGFPAAEDRFLAVSRVTEERSYLPESPQLRHPHP